MDEKATALAVWECVDGLDSAIEVDWRTPLLAGADGQDELDPVYIVRCNLRPETRTDEVAAILKSANDAAAEHGHKLVVTFGSDVEGKVTFA